MDIGNDGLGICDTLVNVGNDRLGVCDALETMVRVSETTTFVFIASSV